MYNFDKQAERIINEGKQYGVRIIIENKGHSPKDAEMKIDGYSGSDSVCKSLTRKIATFNRHIQEGF